VSNVFFPVQPRGNGGQGVNVVRRYLVRPWYYALISSYDEEIVGDDLVRVHVDFQCLRKSWFDALQGPPFPPMNGLALAGSMRNFTLSVRPAKLWAINGVIDGGEDDDDPMNDERAQPAHFHEGNWVELLFSVGRVGVPVVLRVAQYTDPAFIDTHPDERLACVRMIRRVRPPSALIRLRQFVAGG